MINYTKLYGLLLAIFFVQIVWGSQEKRDQCDPAFMKQVFARFPDVPKESIRYDKVTADCGLPSVYAKPKSAIRKQGDFGHIVQGACLNRTNSKYFVIDTHTEDTTIITVVKRLNDDQS
ncbi:hypothetical protein KBC04_05355 [Candidatus Babeliales bacterium]|nr:hypothetical protein [Candidatus Babeliales bacterium]MBP9844378.1 hypothetical protein [Candidatus Babeliales bacterium]